MVMAGSHAAARRKTNVEDAPEREPMRASINGARRNPSTDQKKARRRLVKKAGYVAGDRYITSQDESPFMHGQRALQPGEVTIPAGTVCEIVDGPISTERGTYIIVITPDRQEYTIDMDQYADETTAARRIAGAEGTGVKCDHCGSHNLATVEQTSWAPGWTSWKCLDCDMLTHIKKDDLHESIRDAYSSLHTAADDNRVRAVTQGDDIGTWIVHRNDGSSTVVDKWDDEMHDWHRRHYHDDGVPRAQELPKESSMQLTAGADGYSVKRPGESAWKSLGNVGHDEAERAARTHVLSDPTTRAGAPPHIVLMKNHFNNSVSVGQVDPVAPSVSWQSHKQFYGHPHPDEDPNSYESSLHMVGNLRTAAGETSTCKHCGRTIVNEGDGMYAWIDPEATGDDSIWRETCDANDTFTAEHEPVDKTASLHTAENASEDELETARRHGRENWDGIYITRYEKPHDGGKLFSHTLHAPDGDKKFTLVMPDGSAKDYSRREYALGKESKMNEAQLLAAMGSCNDIDRLRELDAQLQSIRASRRTAALGAQNVRIAEHVIDERLAPRTAYVRTTAATDWVNDLPDADGELGEATQLAAAEASMWYRSKSDDVRANDDELAQQVMGASHRFASRFGVHAAAVEHAYISEVERLHNLATRRHGDLTADQLPNGPQWVCPMCGVPQAASPTPSESLDDHIRTSHPESAAGTLMNMAPAHAPMTEQGLVMAPTASRTMTLRHGVSASLAAETGDEFAFIGEPDRGSRREALRKRADKWDDVLHHAHEKGKEDSPGDGSDPDLSGEWAGVPHGPEVFSDILARAGVNEDEDEDSQDMFNEALDEYEKGYRGEPRSGRSASRHTAADATIEERDGGFHIIFPNNTQAGAFSSREDAQQYLDDHNEGHQFTMPEPGSVNEGWEMGKPWKPKPGTPRPTGSLHTAADDDGFRLTTPNKTTCKRCGGSGYVTDAEGNDDRCTACDGRGWNDTGRQSSRRTADIVRAPIPGQVDPSQSGEAVSGLPPVQVGQDVVAWPWELDENGQRIDPRTTNPNDVPVLNQPLPNSQLAVRRTATGDIVDYAQPNTVSVTPPGERPLEYPATVWPNDSQVLPAPWPGSEMISSASAVTADYSNDLAFGGNQSAGQTPGARGSQDGVTQDQGIDPGIVPEMWPWELPVPLGSGAADVFDLPRPYGVTGGRRPFVGSQVLAVGMSRQHYEHLAGTIANAPVDDDTRTRLAHHVADHVGGMNPHFDRNKFVQFSQTGAYSGGGRARSNPASYTRGHYQAVADAVKSFDTTPENKSALADHFTGAMRGTNPGFKEDVFRKRISGSRHTAEGDGGAAWCEHMGWHNNGECPKCGKIGPVSVDDKNRIKFETDEDR